MFMIEFAKNELLIPVLNFNIKLLVFEDEMNQLNQYGKYGI